MRQQEDAHVRPVEASPSLEADLTMCAMSPGVTGTADAQLLTRMLRGKFKLEASIMTPLLVFVSSYQVSLVACVSITVN